MTFKGTVIVLVVVGMGVMAYVRSPWRTIRHAPGILVKGEPRQEEILPVVLAEVEGWKLTGVANYKVQALVLGTKRYHGGADADLVPIDVALGWRRMSDQQVIDQFSISMGNRFFFYEWSDRPAIPEQELKISAANNHVISANDEVRSVIGRLRCGQIVTLHGYLVNAATSDGRSWRSSLRRDDTGNGACELFYVESASAVDSVNPE